MQQCYSLCHTCGCQTDIRANAVDVRDCARDPSIRWMPSCSSHNVARSLLPEGRDELRLATDQHLVQKLRAPRLEREGLCEILPHGRPGFLKLGATGDSWATKGCLQSR